MKKIYWRTHYMAQSIVVFVCLFSLAALAMVEYFKKPVPQKFYSQKLAAAALANQAMVAIKTSRQRKKLPIDTELDPQKSGLIGISSSSITAGQGNLLSTQTSINPNIAALVIEWGKQAGLKRGDTVAIGLTGSFPALNISVLAAVKTLGLQPIIIASATSAQWGANIPGLSWLEMQKILRTQDILPYMPIAASLGGIDDRARGVSKPGQYYLKRLIDSQQVSASIQRRMEIYTTAAGKAPIKAYINIGKDTAVEGLKIRKILKDGFIQHLPSAADQFDSVMIRFLKMDVPVINLTSPMKIAEQHDFPIGPQISPPIGQGPMFFRTEYNSYFAGGALGSILILLTIVSIVGRKLFHKRARQEMDFP